MNIGDVFFALRGSDGGLQVDAKKAAEAAGATGATSFRASFDAKLKGLGAAGGVAGFGVAAGMAAWNALGASVHGVVQFMGDAVHAAMEDEASQVKLRAALEANVKGWDGNTDAIEKVIKARMKLGFSDEDQRASLAVLVAKTGDVTSALKIQGAAMDLARLKGIDLAAASKAIAMGMSGSGKALKELGINVKDYASANEILAAIQKKASGQAEAYANTTAGAMEVMNVQIGEAIEAVGYKLLPYIKDLAVFASDTAVPAVMELVDALGRLGENTAKELKGIQKVRDDFVDSLANFVGPMPGPWHKELTASVKTFTDAEVAAGAAALYSRNKMKDASDATVWLGKASSKSSLQVDMFADSADRAKSAFELMGDKFKATWSELSAAASGAADDIFGPQIRASNKAANEREQAAQRAIIASRKSTAAEKQDAKDRLLALQQEGLGIQIEMAGRGELTKVAYNALITSLQKQATSGNLQIASSAQVALNNLARLRTAIYTLPAVTTTGQRAVGGSAGRAAGGPVTAGMPYIVNERTAHSEWFVPETSGRILTADQAAGQGLGRGGATYNVTVNNPEPRAAGPDIGRVLRRISALGMA